MLLPKMLLLQAYIVNSNVRSMVGIIAWTHTLPLFQTESVDTINGYQPKCNDFTRHSNDMKITPPPPAFKFAGKLKS